MNMNESIPKDEQGEEEQNNFSSGGKPGSYNSNSNSAQRKKSFSTTKPTEYNLPKEQPESTSKNLETKAKNILLPWRKKHDKNSANSTIGTAANTGHHTDVAPDVNPISNDPKASAGPNATIATHGYSYVKTTTPAVSSEHSKVKTSPPASDHRSNVKTTSPTIHEHSNIGTGHSGLVTAHGHTSPKNRTTSVTKHEHPGVNSGSTGTTVIHGHSNTETTSPTNIHEYHKSSIGPSATAATHGHANVKSTTVPTSHAKTNSNSSTSSKATNTSHHHSTPKTVFPTTHGNSNAEGISSDFQGNSNFDSNSDRDVIPGSFRGITGGDLSSVDPSVYTDSSPKSCERTTIPHYTAIGPPQDTMKEIAENVKMNESEQTGLKNDQISGPDAMKQQSTDPKYKRTMGVSSGASNKQPLRYNDDVNNIQYPEKTKVEKQNISKKASEKFRSERDDILDSGDNYQEKNVKSKTASSWGPIEYSSSTGKNKNLQDVVVPPSVKDGSHNVTSVPQDNSEAVTNMERAKYDDVKGTKNDSLQDVFGSQIANTNAEESRSNNEGHWSGVSKGSATSQSIVMPPAMKDNEDLKKGSYSKPHQYGLDYLDDVEDYNKNDIDGYSNIKDEFHQDKQLNNGYDKKQQVPGTYKVDALSKSAQRQDENPISPSQITHQVGMTTAGDKSLGGYEYSNMSGASKLSDLNKNNSGPTPTRSNFIDQIEPRRAKTTENISSNSKDSNNREPSNRRTVGTGKEGIRSKNFSSTPFDNSENSDAITKKTGVALSDDGRTAGTRDAETAAYDDIENTGSGNFGTGGMRNANKTYANSRESSGVTYDHQRSSEEKSADRSGHNISSQEEDTSDDDMDVNKNAKVLEKDAPGYKRKVDLKNKRRTDIGDSDAGETYAAEVGNYPSLIDPRVPTYGFKDNNTSSSQKTPLSSTSETADPETATYLIHNETTSQGRKVSVGSAGSGKLKHHHNHSHHHSRQSSSKASDYEYNSNHSLEHTPRHHRSDSNEGEQRFEGTEEDKEQTGKQSFMGRVRNSISGGTFGFRSEI